MSSIGNDNNVFLPTGQMVYYYRVCQRKLWYFAHGIALESGFGLVSLGKVLDENTYAQQEHQVLVDNRICMDFVDGDTIHETKKSNRIEEASILQLQYYIFYMKNFKGKLYRGILHYPQTRQAKEVHLSVEDECKMRQVIEDIKTLIDEPMPPIFAEKKICKHCAYFDMCAV